jgi:hypothetical protein
LRIEPFQWVAADSNKENCLRLELARRVVDLHFKQPAATFSTLGPPQARIDSADENIYSKQFRFWQEESRLL